PTILAAIDDLKLKDPTLLVMGMGTHIDPKVALYRAITEAAQSRLTQIHGAREDTNKADMKRRIGYERIKRMNWFYLNQFGVKTKTSDFTIKASDDILEDINTVLDVLMKKGINRAIVVDLTRKELNIPVVRVLIPQLEQYGIDNSRIGSRGRMREVDKNYYLFGPKPSSRRS
ncbi:MAG: methanogenesis marker 1 protein, partial [Candidatus Methanofastidiosa archaeon]|nr:methanogenesis marker 1 protein [Candidatus Methanofastidiosa archaeon]